MAKVNDNYLKLPGSYLFSTIAKKVNAFTAANPDKQIIRLGIGDVTQPLPSAVISSLHTAVDEMAAKETFRGYAPDLGYEFLRSAIAKNDYADRGANIEIDEIFISDGAKSDSGNIADIFSVDNKIAVCDPVYPVYVDSNVMAGRTGVRMGLNGETGKMVAFIREDSEGYSIRYEGVDCENVCNQEKVVPREWISEDGTDILKGFEDYVLPLICGEAHAPIENGLPKYCYRIV